MLYVGTEKLNHASKADIWLIGRYRVILLVSLVVFIWFSVQFYITAPATATANSLPRFALLRDALVFTYVLPHIVAWLLGVVACLHLATYEHKAPGTVYRALFQDLYKGLMLVFLCMSAAQFIIISSLTVDEFSPLLGLSYGIIALAVQGFVMIDRGTNQLTRLEQV